MKTQKFIYIASCLFWIGTLNFPFLFRETSDGEPFFQILLAYVNIPATFGVADIFGRTHFLNSNYGVIPATTLAWFIVFLFWCFVALVISLFPFVVIRLLKGKKESP